MSRIYITALLDRVSSELPLLLCLLLSFFSSIINHLLTSAWIHQIVSLYLSCQWVGIPSLVYSLSISSKRYVPHPHWACPSSSLYLPLYHLITGDSEPMAAYLDHSNGHLYSSLCLQSITSNTISKFCQDHLPKHRSEHTIYHLKQMSMMPWVLQLQVSEYNIYSHQTETHSHTFPDTSLPDIGPNWQHH